MTPDLVAILVSVVLVILAITYLVLGWQRARSWRNVLIGAGVALTVSGLWLGGIMNLLVNGLRSLVSWWSRQVMNTRTSSALALVAIGIIVYGIGHAIAPVPKQLAQQRRKERAAKLTDRRQAKADASKAGVSTTNGGPGKPVAGPAQRPKGAGASTKNTSPNPSATGLSTEDAEIDRLLKSRGL